MEIYLTEILKAFGLVMIFFGALYLADSLNVPPPEFICDIIEALKKYRDARKDKRQ